MYAEQSTMTVCSSESSASRELVMSNRPSVLKSLLMRTLDFFARRSLQLLASLNRTSRSYGSGKWKTLSMVSSEIVKGIQMDMLLTVCVLDRVSAKY